jgi:Putative Ig domain
MFHLRAIRLLLLLILTLTFTLAACGDDDDDDSSGDDDSNDDVDDDLNDDLDDDLDDDVDDDLNDDLDDDADDDTQPAPEAPVIVHDFPPVAQPGQPYEYPFEAEGGTPPYSNWRILETDELRSYMLDPGAPDGLTVNPDTGVLSGTAPNVEETIFYFVVEVDDADPNTGPGREAFGIRVGNPAEDGPLLTKARNYQEVYDLRHNSDGLSVTADNPDDPGGDYWYTDLGDACFIHGNSSAGAAFWYAVEPGPESLANAQLHARGLDLLNRVNGVPGLLSRSYMPKDAPMRPGEFQNFWPENDDHEGEGEFEDYYWKGDVSIDQYSGELVGLSWLYDLVDDETVRDTVRRTTLEIADYMWANNLIIIDADGEPTQFGDFRGWFLEGVPLPNGLASTAALAWFKLAHRVSGDQQYQNIYNELIDERGYPWVTERFLWVYLGYQTKHYNVYMGFENMSALTRMEDDPELKQRYADAFASQLWYGTGDALSMRRGRVEANPTFTPWYLYSTQSKDPDAIIRVIWQLWMFSDAPLRDRYIQNSANPDIEINPEQPTDSLYPLPAHLRKPDMCFWHRSPYELDGGADNGRERTGHDYLLPYWMGRHYGYIGPNW